MAAEKTTAIAWSGVRLAIPERWEPRVAGSRHLVFEEDFQPILQLRWYNPATRASKESQLLAASLARQDERAGETGQWAAPWRQLESRVQVLAFAAGREGTPSGGAFSCRQCHTLFHFQIFPDMLAKGRAIAEVLSTLSCHGHGDDLWRMQDFSLALPPGFYLTEYSFASGLTRLSFQARELRLDAARLAPAGELLAHQPLEGILVALAGVADLQLPEATDLHSREGFRSPGLVNRLRLRLRRERPFVRARIRHDPDHNRLLSLVLRGPRPLPAGLLPELADNYAIF